MVKEIREDQVSIKASISNLEDTVGNYSQSIGAISSSLSKMTETLSLLTSDTEYLKKKLADVEFRLSRVEQERLRNTIEIRGIPFSDSEITEELVCKLGAALGVKIETSQIDYSYRIRPKPQTHLSQAPNTPTIVARFVSSRVAAGLIQAKKRKPSLTLGDLNTGLGPNHLRIYVNESLSPQNRRLYAAARDLKKEGKIRYLWVRNGRVFARVNDGSERLSIVAEEDLNKLY